MKGRGMDIANLKRDSGRINAGEWVGQIPEMGELRLKVRGQRSESYKLALGRHVRAVPRDQRERDGSPSPDAYARCVALAVHEAVLLDWDGLTSEGKPVKYNRELALKWLRDPDYSAFLEAVLWASAVVDGGRNEAEAALAKN